ncbi:GTP-binding protein [Paraburkholderia sp. UYCP14C]|uniref:CobW family GTP-binding protein n=1 Tax=Paraburkholderia sp. UYCP14C TaxID=2511130 RepID=UPI00101FDFF8|nr:GTP-binding protein [Paraburkholderia sp. UYCP14C]RZF25185.1 GTP-binding protein [Paraburkholderia sp. UYCP14C]
MHRERIPIYVMTGFLGSGKSALLARWMKEVPFSNAALIVNEIGEVDLDHATPGFAADTSTLLAEACVCCNGLPALNEALETLFWARLHRSIPRFGMVVIETTGLADPGPLIASLTLNSLVKERYCIAGTFTTIAAHHAATKLARFDEARAQLRAADVVILTHTDLADQVEVDATESLIADHYAGSHILHSANGSLRLHDALTPIFRPAKRAERAVVPDVPLSRLTRTHGAITHFVAMDDVPDSSALCTRLRELTSQYGESLLRLKGCVRLRNGRSPVIVQFVLGDRFAQIAEATSAMAGVKSGLTLVVKRK